MTSLYHFRYECRIVENISLKESRKASEKFIPFSFERSLIYKYRFQLGKKMFSIEIKFIEVGITERKSFVRTKKNFVVFQVSAIYIVS